MSDFINKINSFCKFAMDETNFLASLGMDDWEEFESAISEEIKNLNIRDWVYNKENNPGSNYNEILSGPVGNELSNDGINIEIVYVDDKLSVNLNNQTIYESQFFETFNRDGARAISFAVQNYLKNENLEKYNQPTKKDLEKSFNNSSGTNYEDILIQVKYLSSDKSQLEQFIKLIETKLLNNNLEKEFIFDKFGIKDINNLYDYYHYFTSVQSAINDINFYILKNDSSYDDMIEKLFNKIKDQFGNFFICYMKLPKLMQNGFSEKIKNFIHDYNIQIPTKIKDKKIRVDEKHYEKALSEIKNYPNIRMFIQENTVGLTGKPINILEQYYKYVGDLLSSHESETELLLKNFEVNDVSSMMRYLHSAIDTFGIDQASSKLLKKHDITDLALHYKNLSPILKDGFSPELKEIFEESKGKFGDNIDLIIDNLISQSNFNNKVNLFFKLAKKKEKENLDGPRMIFYKNYDYIDDGSGIGPGEGFYQNMHKYKSVKDFLEKSRKRNKKSSITQLQLLKLAYDFPADSYLPFESYEITEDVVGGQSDYANPTYDFEGKSIDQLNFGRDYVEDEIGIEEVPIKSFTNHLYGIDDGVEPEDEDFYYKNPFDGILESDSASRNSLANKANNFYLQTIKTGSTNEEKFLSDFKVNSWKEFEKILLPEIKNLDLNSFLQIRGDADISLSGPIANELENKNIVIKIHYEDLNFGFFLNENLFLRIDQNFDYHTICRNTTSAIKNFVNKRKIIPIDYSNISEQTINAIINKINEKENKQLELGKLTEVTSTELIKHIIAKLNKNDIKNISSIGLWDLTKIISDFTYLIEFNIPEVNNLSNQIGIGDLKQFVDNLSNYVYSCREMYNAYNENDPVLIVKIFNKLKQNYNKLPKICQNGLPSEIEEFLYNEYPLQFKQISHKSIQRTLEEDLIKEIEHHSSASKEKIIDTIEFVKNNTVNLSSKPFAIIDEYFNCFSVIKPTYKNSEEFFKRKLEINNLHQFVISLNEYVYCIKKLLSNSTLEEHDLEETKKFLMESYENLPELVKDGYCIDVVNFLK